MSLASFWSSIFSVFFPSHPTPAPAPAPTQSIAQIAAGNDSFDILVAALDATGLTPTFAAPGDFTVFAPTDDAFRELATTTLGLDIAGKSDAEVAGALVGALGADLVKDVLFYHVKAGATDLAHLQAEGSVDTLLAGSSFDVSGNTLVDADPEVENPAFVAGLTDIQATNGVIQVIDRVLLPIDVAEAGLRDTIADIAGSNAAFETVTAALVATGLDAVLDNRDGDFTVFAPTDDAFRKLAADLGLDVSALGDAAIAGALVGALGADLVTDVLLYHVKIGAATLAELQSDRLVDTALEGAPFAVDGTELVDADPEIANASFISGLTDIEAANGNIQAIDRVLLPLDIGTPQRQVEFGSWRDDVIFGGGANDLLLGRFGDDLILGGAGDDKIGGGFGHDTLLGGAGNDRAYGGIGNDTLFAGSGKDKLFGGLGHDTLIAGEGRTWMFGGLGKDDFDFSDLSGRNTVADFGWRDDLVFTKSDFATAQDVLDAAEKTRKGLEIETDDGTVLLRHVWSLDADDIVLV